MARLLEFYVKCDYCGWRWQPSIDELRAAEVIIYRGEPSQMEKIVSRRVRCPNCDKDVIARVPKELLDDK